LFVAPPTRYRALVLTLSDITWCIGCHHALSNKLSNQP
jgi:hypothetical protein